MTEPLLETTTWIAHVVVSSGLAHLDRPFDYLIPDDLVGRIQVGARVRVKLAGRLCDGVVMVVDHEQEPGVQLSPVVKLISEQVVSTPNQLRLARKVADHWAGTLDEVASLSGRHSWHGQGRHRHQVSCHGPRRKPRTGRSVGRGL